MKSINNSGYNKETAIRLVTKQAYVYKPQIKEDWTYSHHSFITYFKGRFYALWSSGRQHEDFFGQRVMISSSEDVLHWEKPYPIMDSAMGDHCEVTFTACGFYVYDGKLNVYIGRYEYAPNAILPLIHAKYSNPSNLNTMFPSVTHRNTKLLVLTSEDGRNFSGPVDTGLPIVPNYPPQTLLSGRILISGNVMFPYSDDKTGIDGWHKTGIYPKSMEESVYDDSEGLEIVETKCGWPTHRCEGSFYQTPDGTINMLLRSAVENNTCILYCSQSFDNGESWTQPTATGFTNDGSKFHFGKLPDGRYYYVGNPTVFGNRCPLVLSISEDGVDFGNHYIIEDQIINQRFQGIFKGGLYGYPHSLIHDNTIYIIYSINKEDVAVSGFPLENL